MTDKKKKKEDIKEETPKQGGEAAEEATQAADEETKEDVAEETVEEEKPVEPEEDSETKYMRLMADFQNYKKRVEKEKSDVYSFANEKIATDLLDVLDNFERALDHEATDEGFKTGMEMIFKQFFEVLEKSGLAEIKALGETFDPNVHNAVMTEDTEEFESGIVSGVMQKGYTLNGKVIRPSMVKVAN